MTQHNLRNNGGVQADPGIFNRFFLFFTAWEMEKENTVGPRIKQETGR